MKSGIFLVNFHKGLVSVEVQSGSGGMMFGLMTPGLETENIIACSVVLIALVSASARYKILDEAGIIAAIVLGSVVGFLGHWTWLIILLGFLAASHKVTKWKFDEKSEKGLSESEDGHRSWGNVIANGGLPGLAAIFSFLNADWENGIWIFSAAVAVATADTFASEIGCLDNRVRMITTMKPCKAGVNGGFSPNGQLAAAIGSLAIATLAIFIWLLSGEDFASGLILAAVVAIIGWLGCQVDSVLGAVLENRGLMTKGIVNATAITWGIAMMYLYLELDWL
jgi:uncharacterized protein (TIGR00297 family)